MYEDKIVKGGEITSQGDFSPKNGAMYLFIVAKTENAPGVGIFSVKLSRNEAFTDYSFVAGIWYPVVVKSANITSTDLSNYRIFWGETL